jgi:hypothetical protein
MFAIDNDILAFKNKQLANDDKEETRSCRRTGATATAGARTTGAKSVVVAWWISTISSSSSISS